MSKTYIFKRNRSQDVWRPVQQTPTSRRRSLTRERPESRSGGVYKSEFPLHESLTRSSDTIGTGGSPSMRRMSASHSPNDRGKLQRHRDLKRKFIFQLHDEIEKPIHTTVLEEISDLDRITSICLSTLHQMMENKHQRKFLHHMNITNNSNNNHLRCLNISNNSKMPKRNDIPKRNDQNSKISKSDSEEVSTTVERFISATM